MVVFLVLDITAMGARLYVRTRLIKRSFGWDDMFLCLTLVRAILLPHCKSEA